MTTTRRLAAILAADVEGYSRLIGADEGGTLQAFKDIQAELFEPTVATDNGRLVKTTGDGFLVELAQEHRSVGASLSGDNRPSSRDPIAARTAAAARQTLGCSAVLHQYERRPRARISRRRHSCDQAVAFLSHWKDPNSPRGPIMIDPETRDIVQNVYIRRVEKQGEVLANIEIATIPMVKNPWKELNPLK